VTSGKDEAPVSNSGPSVVRSMPRRVPVADPTEQVAAMGLWAGQENHTHTSGGYCFICSQQEAA